jgi:hypothetical protein
MPGLDPGIHAFPFGAKASMAGTSPGMTSLKRRLCAFNDTMIHACNSDSNFKQRLPVIARSGATK